MKYVLTAFVVFFLFATTSHGNPSVSSSGWQSFDCSAGKEYTFSFDKYVVTIKPRDINLPAPDREDKLTLVIKNEGKNLIRQDFVSSYGRGMITIKSGYIFLEYGLGRGTSVREEYIKAYSLLADYEFIKELVEVFEIQKSHLLPPHKPSASPDKVSYKVKIDEDTDKLNVIFYGAEKGYGLPERKEIILNRLIKD